MDKEGESSSAYTPATPAKGGDRSENMMDKNWLRTPFDEALFEDTSTRKSFGFWEGNLGAPSVNYEMRNTFSVDDVETWHRVPCLDLLALAESSDKSVKLHNFLSDQNAPPLPETVTVTATEAQFTPVTPDQGRKSVNLEEQPIVEANEKGLAEKVEINLNETPEQPKQKRRKHRPKVVKERKPRTPKTPKTPQTPKPEGGSSTGKRKYVRKKVVEKTPEDQINKSCKRRIDFDEVKEKTQVETCPITPDKTELSKETLKTGGEKAKCRIDFSEGTREKRVSVYPNESSCSTVQPWDKNAQVCEAYLSMFTDYSSGSKHEALLSAIYKRRKIEKHQTSITSTTVSSGESCKYKKKTKSLAVVHETVSCAGKHEQHMRMEMEATKKWGKKGRKNIGCILNDIDAIIKKFEQLNLAEKDRVAIVPFSSKNREIYANENKNAMVLYQGHGGLVPYDGVFNPIKRRKPRPKVDLDDETSRVWRLLLEDINSQGIDGTDEDKAKWWEEERRVFRGRADSFIARMHLVQGDRRFSRWKGSVLDSVVGVFLTQNVSDHLSSSAFMSLASRYPLKTKSEPSPSQVNEEEQEEETMMLNNNESCEVSKNNAYTVDLNDNLECEEVPEPSEKDLIISEVEDIITSSQNSENTSPSSVQSSSVVNTTEKEQKESSKSTPFLGGHTSFVELLHMQGTTKVQEECRSEESGLSVESATQVTVQMVKSNSSDGDRCQIVTEGEKVKSGKKRVNKVEWDRLRLEAEVKEKREKTPITMDSLDYEAMMNADVNEIADAIKERGMNNVLAARIKDLLDRLVKDHGSIDLEWLRDVPPDKAKEYLLSFRGLGLKSVECVRLLTLHHLAFPVDTNVGRIAVRLGWVPLQPLPESLQLHLLELYPVLESIQKYLWPRLCKLDQRTLYELHYQMITFGKVFCTKSKPNCNACPMRGECRHFASAFASARLGLPAPEEGLATLTENKPAQKLLGMAEDHHQQTLPPATEQLQQLSEIQNCNPVIEEPATPSGPIIEVPATPAGPIVEVPASPEPIVEVPATPEPEQIEEFDMEDFGEDSEEIPMIKLNMEEFTQNLQTYMEKHMELGECDMSKALVALTSEAAAIPTPKLKNVSQLRTEHQVYELPDTHPLLQGLDTREPDDPCSYLLAIWTPGETADSIQPPAGQCSSQESGTLCNEETCFFCNSTREANSQTVRGTLLIPCRTAMRGSFPLNGTYFQVNEVFADHDSSLNPIDVPRSWLWNLPRRTVYFGTSIPTIFKGLTTEDIQYCFWRGFVCVRGFDQKTRAPRPLMARLHFPASKIKRTKTKTDDAN